MQTTRFFLTARAHFHALVGAAFALYACSFQDFDYLQKGSTAEGGADTGGQGHTGGRSDSGGTGGGSQGGTSGGKSSEGGKPASGGVSAGGAGASAGVGGDGEQGGDGGSVGGADDVGGAGGWGPGTGGVGTAGDSGGGQGGSAGDGPVLVGNLLGNPSFEQQLTGWTVDPPSAVTSKYVYTQFPQGNGTTVDGSYELSVWHMTAEYEFSIYQVVKRLTPGIYSFKGSFSSQAGREAYLFARNCGGTERQVSIPHVSFEWFEIAIPDIEVTSSSCEVGFFVHNVGADWLNADMFTFEKVP